MTALAILFLGALAVFLNHRFIRPHPLWTAFNPKVDKVLRLQMSVDIVIVLAVIVALIAWC